MSCTVSKESIRFFCECNYHKNQISMVVECKICFNNINKLRKSSDNVVKSSFFIEVDDMIFHQYIKLKIFETTK
jgi:hypothetical protein